MPQRSTHFRLSLRTLWVGLLALALMLQPMGAAIGEVHELGQGARLLGTAAAHVDYHGEAVQEDRAPGDSESNDPMHVLLHLAHCCSHTPTPPDAAHAQLLAISGSDAPVVPAAELRLNAPVTDVLRPPIA